MEAAEAAELAARAGKFWEMHDLLYDNQRRLGTSDLVGYASSLGLNGDEFREGLAGHAMRARIGEDVLTGEESGVQGTPWFFINGEYYDGTWEPEELLAALRAAVQTG
jgi:protein-disulfide isomerase